MYQGSVDHAAHRGMVQRSQRLTEEMIGALYRRKPFTVSVEDYRSATEEWKGHVDRERFGNGVVLDVDEQPHVEEFWQQRQLASEIREGWKKLFDDSEAEENKREEDPHEQRLPQEEEWVVYGGKEGREENPPMTDLRTPSPTRNYVVETTEDEGKTPFEERSVDERSKSSFFDEDLEVLSETPGTVEEPVVQGLQQKLQDDGEGLKTPQDQVTKRELPRLLRVTQNWAFDNEDEKDVDIVSRGDFLSQRNLTTEFQILDKKKRLPRKPPAKRRSELELLYENMFPQERKHFFSRI